MGRRHDHDEQNREAMERKLQWYAVLERYGIKRGESVDVFVSAKHLSCARYVIQAARVYNKAKEIAVNKRGEERALGQEIMAEIEDIYQLHRPMLDEACVREHLYGKGIKR